MKRHKPRDPRKISEALFQEEVRKIALMHSWKYYHPWLSIHSTGGYPDCTMVHAEKKRIIFAELKADGKELRQDQQEWIDELTTVTDAWLPGMRPEIYVWHPSDIEQIWEILRR